MKTITLRELHQETGRWVRHAAAGESLIIMDRGRSIVELRRIGSPAIGRPLPDRETRIRRRPRIVVDSVRCLQEMRNRA